MTLHSQDYQILSTFRRELRVFLATSERLAKAQGIPPRQHQAILAIKGRPDDAMSIGGLAAALLIKPNTAVELVDRLVEAGLVLRNASPKDRRTALLSLTPKAESILAALSEAHLEELRRMEPALSRLLARLRQDEPGGNPGAV